MFNVTDFTDTITVKMFLPNAQVAEAAEQIKKGAFVKIKGVTIVDKFDHELTIGSVIGIKKIPDFTTSRVDTSPVKRVELHCHTKMSDMDGVTDAARTGKKSLLLGGIRPSPSPTTGWYSHSRRPTMHWRISTGPTGINMQKDHPDVSKEELKKISSPFKVIYGMEAYLVDDLKGIVENGKGQSLDGSFVVFDIETTGFSPAANKIIEIGAVRVEEGKITDRFSSFVNPQVPISFKIENLTGINDSMVVNERTIDQVLPEFLEFSRGAVMVAHNASFDMSFIEKNCRDIGYETDFTSGGYGGNGPLPAARPEPVQAGYGGQGAGCASFESSPCCGRCGLHGGDFRTLSQDA